MAFQSVHTALAYVAKIACAESKSGNREVQGEEVAHGRCITWVGETDVMVVSGMGDFIIRLSVLQVKTFRPVAEG